MNDREEIKLYFDIKSPYAYLAAAPSFELPERYDVALRWIPFQLRIKGRGERSVYSEYKVRYSYLDARRWANRRGGFTIRGPRKIYDSTASLIGALWAEREGFFREYLLTAYARFFEHELEIDELGQIAELVSELGSDAGAFADWASGEGAERLEAAYAEAAEDHVFGVPFFLYRGEPFWGHDRIPLLEERLAERGRG